jgi:hypothetical protein
MALMHQETSNWGPTTGEKKKMEAIVNQFKALIGEDLPGRSSCGPLSLGGSNYCDPTFTLSGSTLRPPIRHVSQSVSGLS